MLTQAGPPAHPAGHGECIAPINYSHQLHYQDTERAQKERILTAPSSTVGSALGEGQLGPLLYLENHEGS